jgi:ketosteroid isomerase-like protein
MAGTRELVERFYDAFNRDELDAVRECFSDDMVNSDPSRTRTDGSCHPQEGPSRWRARRSTSRATAGSRRTGCTTTSSRPSLRSVSCSHRAGSRRRRPE